MEENTKNNIKLILDQNVLDRYNKYYFIGAIIGFFC